MHRRASKLGIYVLILLIVGLAAGIAAAGADDEERVEKRIVIKGPWGGHGHHGSGAFLGVYLTELTPELREHFGAPEDAGVMVSRVVSDSPAERAGVRVGDILTRVNADEVGSSRALKHSILGHDDGDTVDLEVWRDGRIETLAATLEVREGSGHRMMAFGCDEGEDWHDFDFDFDCGEGEDCKKVVVRCDDGDCQCTQDGEEVDCAEIHEHGAQHIHHFRSHHHGDEGDEE